MTQGTQTGTSAGSLSVLVTDGDTHSPAKWAEMTAGRIMSLGSEMPSDRVRKALELRRNIVNVLATAFDQVRAMSLKNETIYVDQIAIDLRNDITHIAQGTPWQLHFSHPYTAQMIRMEIVRTLNSIVSDERTK